MGACNCLDNRRPGGCPSGVCFPLEDILFKSVCRQADTPFPRVYVGYPKIAQGDVNDSTLTITQMTITDPAPDSLHLNLTQVIGSHSHYHPWFDEFDANVTLLGSATPFAVLQIPRVQSKDGAVVRVDQRLQLDNVSAFGEYSKAVMLNEEVNLNVYGRPKMREGKLPKITVTYNKTVTMKGERQRHSSAFLFENIY